MKQYDVQDHLMPTDLLDISNEQVKDHWNLYKAYVKQVNALRQELAMLEQEQKADTLAYADRRRRYNFEANGMVLHEYYFGNLKAGEAEPESGELKRAIIDTFGSYETWKTDFERAGKTRGIGWAILYADPMTGTLTNNFIAEHENGNLAGFHPILVMDVWEHAYMIDHQAGGRGTYIAAFMKNIDWNKVTQRYVDVRNGKSSKRF